MWYVISWNTSIDRMSPLYSGLNIENNWLCTIKFICVDLEIWYIQTIALLINQNNSLRAQTYFRRSQATKITDYVEKNTRNRSWSLSAALQLYKWPANTAPSRVYSQARTYIAYQCVSSNRENHARSIQYLLFYSQVVYFAEKNHRSSARPLRARGTRLPGGRTKQVFFSTSSSCHSWDLSVNYCFVLPTFRVVYWTNKP